MLITIGLEIHLKLNTASKIFCPCKNDQTLDLAPNTHICPICTAQPGALPLLSQECVEKAVIVGNIFGSTIAEQSSFDRKNYFYPDLPMGFQITQFFHPLLQGGKLAYWTDNFQTEHTADIHEAHLECDTAKMIHDGDKTFLDFNRAGTPLLEIVTTPSFSSAEEAVEFAKEVQRVARRNNISDADMEKGQMRIDVNLSLRKQETDPLGTRTEMKNINTFNAMKRAIQHEVQRQTALLDSGQEVAQETRRRDDQRGESFLMRSKEDALDYRYFPEPDLPPLRLSSEQRALPSQEIKLPSSYIRICKQEYGFSKEYLNTLLNEPLLFDYFFELVQQGYPAKNIAKRIAWPLMKSGMSSETFLAEHQEQFRAFLQKEKEGWLMDNQLKIIFDEMLQTKASISDLITQKGFDAPMMTPEELDVLIQGMMVEFPQQLEEFRAGKESLLAFFLGQMMRKTKGKSNPQTLKERLKLLLGK